MYRFIAIVISASVACGIGTTASRSPEQCVTVPVSLIDPAITNGDLYYEPAALTLKVVIPIEINPFERTVPRDIPPADFEYG